MNLWNVTYGDGDEHFYTIIVRAKTLTVRFRDFLLEADGVLIQPEGVSFLKVERNGETVWDFNRRIPECSFLSFE